MNLRERERFRSEQLRYVYVKQGGQEHGAEKDKEQDEDRRAQAPESRRRTHRFLSSALAGCSPPRMFFLTVSPVWSLCIVYLLLRCHLLYESISQTHHHPPAGIGAHPL